MKKIRAWALVDSAGHPDCLHFYWPGGSTSAQAKKAVRDQSRKGEKLVRVQIVAYKQPSKTSGEHP